MQRMISLESCIIIVVWNKILRRVDAGNKTLLMVEKNLTIATL